jgi:hypothetical protein
LIACQLFLCNWNFNIAWKLASVYVWVWVSWKQQWWWKKVAHMIHPFNFNLRWNWVSHTSCEWESLTSTTLFHTAFEFNEFFGINFEFNAAIATSNFQFYFFHGIKGRQLLWMEEWSAVYLHKLNYDYFSFVICYPFRFNVPHSW